MMAGVVGKHFKKILIHKYWVVYYCFKCGLYWQGIIHDLSKFNPVEFIESVKYYQGDKSPLKACKEQNGYSKAWLHHKGRNKHHYQYWVDDFDYYYTQKGLTFIKMPYKYALELVCDYLGASRAYMGKDFSYKKEWEWWLNKRDNCGMNTNTKLFVNAILFAMAMCESSDILLNHDNLLYIYNIEGNKKCLKYTLEI